MGAWGTGIYSNDTAGDVRDACKDIFGYYDVEEGNQKLFQQFEIETEPELIDDDLWKSASARFLLSYAGKETYVHVFITASKYGDMDTVFNSVEKQIVADLGLRIIWHFVK